MRRAGRSPPVVMDTNVLVAGACRRDSSLAHRLLLGVLQEDFPLILTEPIVYEYLDVLGRPSILRLTGLTPRQTEELVLDLTAIASQVQIRFSWRPNLKDESDNKFVEAAVHAAATIVTYNVKDFRQTDPPRHGWDVSTPAEFLARYG